MKHPLTSTAIAAALLCTPMPAAANAVCDEYQNMAALDVPVAKM